jgi:hypothetical protein
MWAVQHRDAEGTSDIRAAFNIGYAIGLVVGEGCFTTDGRTPTLSVHLHMDDPEPLEFLRDLFGGKIYGPYIHQGRHCRVWHLRGADLYDALPTFFEWMPPCRKRFQLEVWALRLGFTCRSRVRSKLLSLGPGPSLEPFRS